MSFIVVFRNPSSKALFAVVNGPDGDLAEFDTEEIAGYVVKNCIWYGHWAHEVVEVDV